MTTYSTQHKITGFTLVELAIALMVIGLLIGGVLKGQELIENTRITRTVKDISDIETAVMIFRNTYNGLPGDLRNAGNKLPNCNEAPCNSTSGMGVSKINSNAKRILFWIHLQRAGLITNINETGNHNTASFENPFGGYYIASYLAAGDPNITNDSEKNVLRLGDPILHAQNARIGPVRLSALDVKMDDGKPLTGKVTIQDAAGGSFSNPTPVKCYDDATREYLIASPQLVCSMRIMMDSMN